MPLERKSWNKKSLAGYLTERTIYFKRAIWGIMLHMGPPLHIKRNFTRSSMNCNKSIGISLQGYIVDKSIAQTRSFAWNAWTAWHVYFCINISWSRTCITFSWTTNREISALIVEHIGWAANAARTLKSWRSSSWAKSCGRFWGAQLCCFVGQGQFELGAWLSPVGRGQHWLFPDGGEKHFSRRGATVVKFYFTNSKLRDQDFSTKTLIAKCQFFKSRGQLPPYDVHG